MDKDHVTEYVVQQRGRMLSALSVVLAVGMHLCKPEFQVQRSFLINMGQEYLERWVFNHLSGGDLGGN